MKRYFYFGLGVMLTLIVTLIGYGAYLNQRDESQISERMSSRTIPLTGAKAQFKDINANIFLEGINLLSEDKTDVIALIDGRITEIAVQKNDRVQKGDVLFMLTNEQQPTKIRQADIDVIRAEGEIIKADNDIRQAETALASAKSNFERYKELHSHDAVSRMKYEEMETIYKQAQLTLENMYLQKNQMIEQKKSFEAQRDQLLLQSEYSKVTAPIDGEVLILYKDLGAYVGSGTALALIGDFRNLYTSFPMDDKEIRRFSIGQEAVLSFSQSEFQKVYDIEYGANNQGKRQNFMAKIVDISPSLDSAAEIRKVIWKVDNSSGILEPQTYGNATFVMKAKKRCLVVPKSAMADAANTKVFVLTAEGTVEPRQVSTGIKDENYIEILSGLKEGEVVITSGTNGLEDGMKVSVTFKSENN